MMQVMTTSPIIDPIKPKTFNTLSARFQVELTLLTDFWSWLRFLSDEFIDVAHKLLVAHS